MVTLGTPFSSTCTKVMLLGSGELGKEVVIELQRLGIEVIAIDHYQNAPAMQVADRAYCISMLDGNALRGIIEQEKPDYIVPEIEAISTDTLIDLEQEGFKVVPSAKAVSLTMNREKIRSFAAETLGLKTSNYVFCDQPEELVQAVETLGLPCVIKPIMSSSGKGQSLIRTPADIEKAWAYAQEGGRAGKGRVIVESFIDFDFEITLLTIVHRDGVSFCLPIGHRQEDGDYQESWQPQAMNEKALEKAKAIATEVTTALGGWGLFGVEFFVKGDEVYFSELSPRPHDTGLVTLISQDLSEFALHVRAFLGLPIPNIHFHGASGSAVLLVKGESEQVAFSHCDEALNLPNTQIRLFGKPCVKGKRRMGVALARAETAEKAKIVALEVAAKIKVVL
jgi:phosphoribosylglycinamide formyltransferase 2